MPREFEDFSKEVSGGTDKIAAGLDKVRAAADAADVSSANLASTQKAGVSVASKYAREMGGVSSSLKTVASSNSEVSRSFMGVNTSVRELTSAIQILNTQDVNLSFDASAARQARDDIENLRGGLEDIADEPPVKIDVELPPNLLAEVERGFKGAMNAVAEEIKMVQAEIIELEEATGKIDKQQFIDLKVRLGGLQELEAFSEQFTEAEMAQLALASESGKLSDALDEVTGSNALLAASMKRAARESEEAARASSTYRGEVDKARTITELFNKKLNEGQDEAQNLAGGLGVTNGRMIGVGVAAFFVAGKVADLIDEFKDAAIELSKFNVELGTLEARAGALGFEGSFDSLRNELNLTRAQSERFFNVLEDGVNSGVASVAQLAQAGKQLRDTFGGDQVDRLEKYVNLLKEIPTLETDLSISASLDDQAAALFALAERGEISAVIDLQAAGLLGGIQTEVISEADVELINAAQKTEKTIEDVQDTLLSYFPSWGPQFGAIAAGTSKTVALLGGTIAALGAVKALTAAQIGAQGQTTAAVYATAGMKGGGLKGLIPKKLTSSVAKIANKIPLLGRLGSATGSVGGAASSAAAAAAPAAAAAAALAFTAALAVGGAKLSDFGDTLEEEGKDVAAGTAKVSAGLLKFAAASAMLPPILGQVVGAFVAGPDVIDGLTFAFRGLSDELLDTVDGVQKYNQVALTAGFVLDEWSKSLDGSADDLKWGLGKAADFAVDIFSSAWDTVANPIDSLKSSFNALSNAASEAFQTDEYKQKVSEAADSAEKLNSKLKILIDRSESYDEAISTLQKDTLVSASVLQRTLRGIENAANTGKTALFDLGASVAELELEEIRELGGTAADFNAAIESSTKNLTRSFEEVSKGLVQQRAEIIKNGNLNANDRRAALEKLNQAELEATKKFVAGVDAVIEALFQSPELIKSGLEREISQLKFDIRITENIGGFDNINKEIQSQFNTLNSEWEATTKAISDSRKEIENAEAALENESKMTAKAIQDAFGDMSDKAKKELAEVSNGVLKVTEEIGDSEFGLSDTTSIEDARKELSNLNKSLDESTDKIDTLRSKLPDKSFAALSSTLSQSAADVKRYQAALDRANVSLEEAKKEQDKSQSTEADEAVIMAEQKVAELTEKRQEALDAQISAQKGMRNNLQKYLDGEKATEKDLAAIKSLGDKIASGKGFTVEQLMEQKSLTEAEASLFDKISKNTQENVQKVVKELALEQEKANKLAQTAVILDSTIRQKETSNKLEVKKQELAVKEGNAIKDFIGKSEATADAALQSLQSSTRNQKLLLDEIRSQEAIALLTNNSTENVLKAQQAQSDIATTLAENLPNTIALFNNQIAEAQEKLKKVGKGTNLEAALKSTIGNLERKIVEAQQIAAEALADLPAIGDAIDESFQKFQESISGRQIAQQIDLSDALGELAEFSDNFAGTIREGTNIAIAAAQREADEKRRIVEQSTAQEIKNAQARAKIIENIEGTEAANQFRQEAKSTLEAKRRAELARIEVAEKRKVAEAAQREASLKTEAIDLEASLVDDQISFLSEIGGSYSQILSLQQRGVDFEREKLSLLQEQLVVSNLTGQERRKLEVAIEKQKLNLQRKQLGAQKDVFEKLLGTAFGELRDVGAARRRASDVGLLGRDRTRVLSTSGQFLRSGAGDVTPLDQRAANRTLGGLSNLGGELKKVIATSASPEDKIEIPMGDEKGPERLEIEKKIQEAGAKTATASEQMSSDIKLLKDAGTTPGSLFTHDVYLESIMTNLLEATVLGVQELQAIRQGDTGESEVDPTNFLNVAAPGLMEEITPEAVASGLVPLGSLGEGNDALRMLSSMLGAFQDQSALTDDASLEGVRGAGTETAAETGIMVKGRIDITMDTKMFRAEMANLMAELINTSEIRNELDKRYLTPSR